MKKFYSKILNGLQKKTVFLVLVMLVTTIAVFTAVSSYQNKTLVTIVGETRVGQQQAISETSKATMQAVMETMVVDATVQQAKIANKDFSQIAENTYMLQTMAEGILESTDSLSPVAVNPPDPSLDGTPSAMVICEEGVDYTHSEYLGYLAHLSNPMIAMFSNSDKIASCYIGLEDGTFFCIDTRTVNKYDENGELIPFPVRERPWYKGAIETGELYFTGIIEDAFAHSLCVTCSAPVVVHGKTVGVVAIDIVLDEMDDFINTSATNTGFGCIINNNGQVILAPKDNSLFEISISSEAEDLRNTGDKDLAAFIDQSLAETTDLKTLTLDGKEYYVAGAPMPTPGWALISIVDKEATEAPEKQMLAEYDRINEEATAQFRKSSAQIQTVGKWSVVLLFLLGVSFALIASGRIVKPLSEMTKNINLSSRTGELFEMQDVYRTNDEIEVLAEAFDDLSKQTKKYIEDITQITKEKERVNTELGMANQIQSSMLPHIFPAFPNRTEFDIYASMDPAKEVGGDFYDFFLIDDDHLCMVMADVSGKGIPAALFMMISKVILQSCAMLGQSAAEILNKTNEALCSSNQTEMFVTVWLGILEISTGIISAANAGHEYPALAQNGPFELYKDKHGFVIGGMDGVKYKEYKIQMNPGDRLFLYTDGVPEATDSQNQMFGTKRMIETLNQEPDAPPTQILKNVRKAVDEFVDDAEQFDDLTMLCIEYHGPQHKS